MSDLVSIGPDSPPVDWTLDDVETARRTAAQRLEDAARRKDFIAAEAAMRDWRSVEFRNGDEKVK